MSQQVGTVPGKQPSDGKGETADGEKLIPIDQRGGDPVAKPARYSPKK